MKRSERKKREFSRRAIAVIGEGPTEQYYLLSLQKLLPVTIFPRIVKTGMEYLRARVEECIAEDYERVYCLIDMDDKTRPKEKKAYEDFLRCYSGKCFGRRSDGGSTEVIVIENRPCLEIWFYYYFRLTTGLYSTYEKVNPLKPVLRQFLPEYEKSQSFFQRCGGLHQYITAKGGSIMAAVRNSELSMGKHDEGAKGAFSAMGVFLKDVGLSAV